MEALKRNEVRRKQSCLRGAIVPLERTEGESMVVVGGRVSHVPRVTPIRPKTLFLPNTRSSLRSRTPSSEKVAVNHGGGVVDISMISLFILLLGATLVCIFVSSYPTLRASAALMRGAVVNFEYITHVVAFLSKAGRLCLLG